MTESIKATRAAVQIGALEVDGFMLPDGSYRMSQAQVAQAVGKPPVNALRFLGSKALKSLLGAGYTDYIPDQRPLGASQYRRHGVRRSRLIHRTPAISTD